MENKKIAQNLDEFLEAVKTVTDDEKNRVKEIKNELTHGFKEISNMKTNEYLYTLDIKSTKMSKADYERFVRDLDLKDHLLPSSMFKFILTVEKIKGDSYKTIYKNRASIRGDIFKSNIVENLALAIKNLFNEILEEEQQQLQNVKNTLDSISF